MEDANQLANNTRVERTYDPDRQSMLAALRAVLGLPKQLPDVGIGVQP